MKLRYILSIAIIAFLSVSCYQDEGNYDYASLNNVDVTITIEDNVIPFDTKLTVTPELKFSQGNNDDLSYEWKFLGHVISKERVLNWTVSPVGRGALALYVTDNKTGVKYIGSTHIEVTTKYGKQGWMILSEKDGKSMLSYITQSSSVQTDEKTGKRFIESTADIDAYRKSNGKELGGSPIKIYEHFRNTQWDLPNMGNYWVLQNGGQGVIDIDGSSFINDVTLEQMFVGGLPSGFVPYDMVDMTYITMVVGQDGKVYSRKKEDVEQYNTGLFTNVTMKDDSGKEIDGRFFVRSPYAEPALAMFYNKPTNNYLAVSTRSSIYAGKIVPVKASDAAYEEKPGFTRLENLGDKSPIYIGAYKDESGSGSIGFVSVLKSTAGKFFLQDFMLSSLAWSNATTPTLIDQKEVDLSNIVDGVSKNVFHLSLYQETSQAPCLFISKGKELWYVYLADGSYYKKLYYTFDGNITSMNNDIYAGRQLAVGLDNGKMCILDSTKDAITGKYGNNILLYSVGDLGTVKQVVYKIVHDSMWVPMV